VSERYYPDQYLLLGGHGEPWWTCPGPYTSRPGRYLHLECFPCGEVAESEGMGRVTPLCSCGLPYSVEVRIRKGHGRFSLGIRRALWALVSPLLPLARVGAPGSPVAALEGAALPSATPRASGATRALRAALLRGALPGRGGR
jgi:hypothetical protein